MMFKYFFNLKTALLLAGVFFLTTPLALASEMVLKSGKTIEGEIVRQTDKYVEIDSGIGLTVTYFNDEIDTIDGQPLDLLFDNSDFERGDLRNWTATGNAFLNQPTFGDNSQRRGRGTANLRGNYWIGGCENHHLADQPWGKDQGDDLTGTLTSVPFIIKRDHIGFMIGGGDSTHLESVALEVEGQEVLVQDGWGNKIDAESMSRVVWDVSKWRGKQARLVVRDNSTGGWGHINVDDFRY